MSDDLIARIVDSAGAAVLRLGQSLATETQIKAIALRLGWTLEPVPSALTALAGSLRAIEPALAATRQDPTSPTALAALIEAVAQGAGAIDALSNVDFGAALPGFASSFPEQLVQWGAIEYLRRERPRLLGALRAAGIVTSRSVDPGDGRPAYREERFVLPDIGAALSSPSTLLRVAWAWGEADFEGAAFLGEIGTAMSRFGFTSGFQMQPASARELGGAAPMGSAWHLVTRMLAGTTLAGQYELGLRWLVFEQDALPALAIIPYVDGTLADTIPLGSLQLAITGMATAGDQIAVVIAPTSITLVEDFRGAGNTPAQAELALALSSASTTPVPMTVGDAGSMTLAGWKLTAKATVSTSAADLALELAFPGASLSLATGGSGLLGAAGVGDRTALPMPFAVGVSATRGVYVAAPDGSPLALGAITLGPVTLRNAKLAVAGVDHGLQAAVTTDVSVAVGPLTIALAGLGAGVTATFPGHGGNLGPVDVTAAAIAPTGGAVSLATAIATGGGVIEHVAGRDYRGALVFDILGVTVSALGLLDDSPQNHGAFVAIAGATFPGIQLGWGFTLDGVGGVIATHRRFDDDHVRAELARGSVSTLLQFSVSSGELLSRIDALAAAFPPTPGRFVVGPTARIGWGTPRMVEADLAVLLEMPSPIRLALLGAVQVGLPTLTQRIVDLRIDVLGVLDFARDTLAIDASLHDSTLAGYALSGALALRLGWGDAPEFLLAIGGFHPRFTPPPNFPALARLQLTAGDNPQLRMSAYLALTSNTAQVGAQADLSYKGGGFTISAQAGFDALFEFSPFQFDVDVHASAAISWHGHNLASVDLDFELTGPHPWHAVGSASFSILWWNPSVGFNATWGDATPGELPPAPDVAGMLRAALNDPSAWHAELAADEPSWLVLVPSPAATLHPLAAMTVRQRVVPLGIAVTAYGNIPLAAPLELTIAHVTIGTSDVGATPVTDAFAPGQFTQMSTDDKLAAPSFEKLDSGVRFADRATTTGPFATASLTEKTTVFDPFAPPPPPSLPTPIRWTVVDWQTRVRDAVPPPPRTGPKLGEVRYVLASTTTLVASSGATSYTMAKQALSEGLQIIPVAHAGI